MVSFSIFWPPLTVCVSGMAASLCGADDKTVYSRSDCLRLAKTITDLSKVPVSCTEIVKNEIAARKAWDGASHRDRAQHAIATSGGKIGHHQLQRRLTTTSESMAR